MKKVTIKDHAWYLPQFTTSETINEQTVSTEKKKEETQAHSRAHTHTHTRTHTHTHTHIHTHTHSHTHTHIHTHARTHIHTQTHTPPELLDLEIPSVGLCPSASINGTNAKSEVLPAPRRLILVCHCQLLVIPPSNQSRRGASERKCQRSHRHTHTVSLTHTHTHTHTYTHTHTLSLSLSSGSHPRHWLDTATTHPEAARREGAQHQPTAHTHHSEKIQRM